MIHGLLVLELYVSFPIRYFFVFLSCLVYIRVQWQDIFKREYSCFIAKNKIYSKKL